MLGIDFQQILLHLFNFTLLALALNFFLYKPITEFIEKREQYYKDIEEKASANLLESENALRVHDEQLANIKAEADKIRQEAIKESQAISNREIELAKEEAQRILDNSRLQAQREKETLLRNTKKNLKQVVVEAATKLAFNEDAYDDFVNHLNEEDHE